ncbi:MAG: class II glutamine amidotransferase [Thermoplasmata archaeon]|nr:class II glutamine amidotransferase [Thermoplasmata archaeon]
MCRLFGLLGNPRSPAEPWLVTADRSLLAQSHHSEKTAQRDGWGIAWYTDQRSPRIEKGVGGAFLEPEVFTRAARSAQGPVVVGHLRHASNPLGLPAERLIGLENSQPFGFHSYLFAHNGSLPFPRETRPFLGKFEEQVRGVNDSEILFWLLVRHTEALGDPLQGYARAVTDLGRVWSERINPESAAFSGLNVLFTRGPNELWAFCLWRGEHGASFYDPHRPYYQMAYIADAKQCVVGSEPFDGTRSDWHSLQNGSYLVARASSGLVTVETGPIPLNASERLALAK